MMMPMHKHKKRQIDHREEESERNTKRANRPCPADELKNDLAFQALPEDWQEKLLSTIIKNPEVFDIIVALPEFKALSKDCRIRLFIAIEKNPEIPFLNKLTQLLKENAAFQALEEISKANLLTAISKKP